MAAKLVTLKDCDATPSDPVLHVSSGDYIQFTAVGSTYTVVKSGNPSRKWPFSANSYKVSPGKPKNAYVSSAVNHDCNNATGCACWFALEECVGPIAIEFIMHVKA
jgi:hypothetical protein